MLKKWCWFKSCLIKSHENKDVLSTWREYTYKALVLANVFDQKNDIIEGLPELEKTHEKYKAFVHMLDTKERDDRNYYHGWNNSNGNLIWYSP